MRKYESLGRYLREQHQSEIALSFSEIERILGEKLPPSAYKHRPWWSNNSANSVITKEWLDAGYRTQQVDMTAKKLVFKRATGPNGMNDPGSPFRHDATEAVKSRSIVGALKGTFTLEAGVDLTAPAMPEWADLIEEKYGPAKPR
jgi:hypothetical protein